MLRTGCKFVLVLFIILLALGVGLFRLGVNIIPGTETTKPATEIQGEGAASDSAAETEPQATPTPAAPTPTPTPTGPQIGAAYQAPYEGFLYGVVIPLAVIFGPWLLGQYFIIRYVQPRGLDLSEIRIKAQDGLFINAAVSMTARRSLTLASTRMTWARVRDFVEKEVEQVLLHEAIQYPTLEELERDLKHITDSFLTLNVIRELERDFGVYVLRFNIETRYPAETMEAINRKADAAAGGFAYLDYAKAARLDPNSAECRELYKIFQETRGQVDAARNLGGGISSLVNTWEYATRHHGERRKAEEEAIEHDSPDN